MKTLSLKILGLLAGPLLFVYVLLFFHPFILMVGCTMAASCAFMLPVATPPNAIIFGSGYLKIKDMVKAGFLMNILSILIDALMIHFLLPILWELK